jgi:taurine transport system permease protein
VALSTNVTGDFRLADRRGSTGAATRWFALVGLIGLLAAWELAAVIIHDPVILPSPLLTAETWLAYMGQPYPAMGNTLWQDALVSLARVLAGFFAGSLVGTGLGALMVGVPRVRAAVDPLIELTRPLPPLAFVPLLVVWFGIGEAPKIILIGIGVVPIMAVATVAALDGVPESMVQAARALGASDTYALLHVRLRGAVPGLITGLRLAMGISWTSIVAVEMIVATSGLGYVILQASLYLVTKLIFAGVITIAILGIGLDSLLRLVQRQLDPTVR